LGLGSSDGGVVLKYLNIDLLVDLLLAYLSPEIFGLRL
jgi:hypothetical protein